MQSHPSEFSATHMYALKYQSVHHEESLIPAGIWNPIPSSPYPGGSTNYAMLRHICTYTCMLRT